MGKGAFAKVFRALNQENGETVAVKEMNKSQISKTDMPKIMVLIPLFFLEIFSFMVFENRMKENF